MDGRKHYLQVGIDIHINDNLAYSVGDMECSRQKCYRAANEMLNYDYLISNPAASIFAGLPASQKPSLKMLSNWHGF